MGLGVTLYNKNVEEELYWAHITHNLVPMAKAVGVYRALWRPEEIKIKKAKDLIPLLEKGLGKLKKNPEKYKLLNAPNGWGVYENFVEFVENYLKACKTYPNAKIEANR